MKNIGVILKIQNTEIRPKQKIRPWLNILQYIIYTHLTCAYSNWTELNIKLHYFQCILFKVFPFIRVKRAVVVIICKKRSSDRQLERSAQFRGDGKTRLRCVHSKYCGPGKGTAETLCKNYVGFCQKRVGINSVYVTPQVYYFGECNAGDR